MAIFEMNSNPMYSARPNLIIGFHGCDKKIRDRIVAGVDDIRPSENEYDWLGSGVYFWENNFSRAYDWAVNASQNPDLTFQPVEEPAVLGAVISLDHCLDLLDNFSIDLVKSAYEEFSAAFKSEFGAIPLPDNSGGHDRPLRKLDCAVINYLHFLTETSGMQLDPFDSVRAVFTEGDLIYPEAGFRRKSHIQICIRNSDCIKGFFVPRHKKGMLVASKGLEVL